MVLLFFWVLLICWVYHEAHSTRCEESNMEGNYWTLYLPIALHPDKTGASINLGAALKCTNNWHSIRNFISSILQPLHPWRLTWGLWEAGEQRGKRCSSAGDLSVPPGAAHGDNSREAHGSFLAIPIPKAHVSAGRGWDQVVETCVGGTGCPMPPTHTPRVPLCTHLLPVQGARAHTCFHRSQAGACNKAWGNGSPTLLLQNKMGLCAEAWGRGWHGTGVGAWSLLVHSRHFQPSTEWSQAPLMRSIPLPLLWIQKQINWRHLFFPYRICSINYYLFPLFLATPRVRSAMRAFIIHSA